MKRAAVFLVAAACVDTKPPIQGTQSLAVTITAPTDLGSAEMRLADTARTITYNLQAVDQDGNADASYTRDVQVYVQYLGTLTPYLGQAPLATVHVVNGVAMNQTITLPPVFGPTSIWFDDGKDEDATYATGASPTLWYRDPYIQDIQQPIDEMSLDALSVSPLQNKNLDVRQSRYGADGRLVVSSVFSQGYTVADMQCGPGGAPPCTAGPYDQIEVFSFSAPSDQHFRKIVEGQVITGFAGGVSEFNGLTEVGFPQTFTPDGDPDVNPAREPTPVKLDPTWFTSAKINFERNEAGPIEVDNAYVCPLDDDYEMYSQWKLAPGGEADCTGRNVINLITVGVIQTDPATLVGKTLPRVVGILRPVNIGSFNVWIIYPRGDADLTLQ
jgi:hypothetical protein